MTTLLRAPLALSDLDEIWDYSASNWNVDQAERYVEAIRDVCLAVHADRIGGRDIGHIRAGYRQVRVKSHVVI